MAMKGPRFAQCFLFGTIFFGVLFLGPVSGAHACECPKKPTLEEAVESSSLVFVGRVLEQGSSPYKPNHTQVTFTVFKRFKGFEELPNMIDILVYVPKGEKACSASFANGYDYVVYANGNPAFFQTDSCSRTELLDKAQVDEQRLQRLFGKKKK